MDSSCVLTGKEGPKWYAADLSVLNVAPGAKPVQQGSRSAWTRLAYLATSSREAADQYHDIGLALKLPCVEVSS